MKFWEKDKLELYKNKIKNLYNKHKKLIDIGFNVFVFLIFCVITFYVAMKHEVWGDEAQAWLIARDLSIPDIISHMKYEGHSCLWYLVLYPFVKLGLPFKYMPLISCMLVNIAALIILFKVETKKIFKLLILFSEPFLYYYSAISRCYAMIPLFVSVLCILYKDKEKHPYFLAITLAFLANVHIIILPFVGMFILVTYIPMIFNSIKSKNKKLTKAYIISCFIALLGIILFLIQVFDLQCVLIVNKLDKVNEKNDFLQKLGESALNVWKEIAFFYVENDISIILALTTVMLILVVSVYYKRQALMFFPTLIIIIILNAIIDFMSNVQRSQLLLILMFFFVVTAKCDKKKDEYIPKIVDVTFCLVFAILCIASTYDVSIAMKDEITSNFSDAQNVAKYILENFEEGYTMYTLADIFTTTTVLAYFDNQQYKFYNLIEDRYYTYYPWDLKMEDTLNMDNIEKVLDKSLQTDERTCIMLSEFAWYYMAHIEKSYDVKLIYDSEDTFRTKCEVAEEYYIYEIKRKGEKAD